MKFFMRKQTTLTTWILAIAILTSFQAGRANAQMPAFPGADGAGAFTPGGRGGIVYHVTKLDRNFSHAEIGTLRYGLNDANFPPGTKRTIVFDVGGTFWLGRYGAERPEYDNGWDAQSVYNFPKNVTIAGQSAPGPVIIMGGVTKSGSSNVIVRNITFATGYGMRGFNEPDKVPPTLPTPGHFPDSSIYDALEINGPNVMLDHLTMVYGSSGTIWCREPASNLTMQYCIVAQGQNYPQGVSGNPGQYRGRAYGSQLQGGPDAKVSILHNLYGHFRSSIVVVNGSGTGPFNDIRNNVTYNWLTWAGYSGGTGGSGNNFINNFYLAGPGGDDVSSTNIIYVPGQTLIFLGASGTRAYVSGNLKDINKDGFPYDVLSADGDHFLSNIQPAAYDVNIGVTLDASNGFSNVLHYVGPRWWERDYEFTANNTNAINTVDERLIYETWTGTGKVMAWADDPFNSDPNEGVEWRGLLAYRADTNTAAAPFNWPANWDTDQDGMPDNWEIEHGLNPYVANNNDDFDNDGYTDLEEYLNDVAAWPAPGNIYFTGETNNRYAQIFNWKVSGEAVNISGLGVVTTSSPWQPSRYDTAIISGATVLVDAVGQHAGILRLTNNATLDITNGWLKASTLEIGTGCTLAVKPAGTLRLTGTGSVTLGAGGTFTNAGTLDIMTWTGTLPAGFVNNGTVLDRSLVQVSSAQVSGSDFQVSIQGYRGHNYQLQYRDDLSGGMWQNVGASVAGANALITFTHTSGATAGQRFYRVAVD
jgi:hypothetical protein